MADIRAMTAEGIQEPMATPQTPPQRDYLDAPVVLYHQGADNLRYSKVHPSLGLYGRRGRLGGLDAPRTSGFLPPPV
jgi:hypothetical protein